MEDELCSPWGNAVARPFGDATHRVYQMVSPEGNSVVRKVFRHGRAFRREKDALEFLHAAGVSGCPRVLAWRASPTGGEIIMSHVAGKVPSGAVLSSERLWHQAGKILGALHQLPLPVVDGLDLRQALKERLGVAEALAVSWCDSFERELLHWLSRRMESLKPRQRVFCHGDWVPRNWLWHNDALAFVDLERSGPNAPEQDFVALHLECWQRDHLGRDAFLEGYSAVGRPMDRGWLDVLVLLYLVGSVNWGLKSEETLRAAQARAALRGVFTGMRASHP